MLNLLLPLTEAASFDADPTAWAGAFEDNEAGKELLDVLPCAIRFRWENNMVAKVVVVSAQGRHAASWAYVIHCESCHVSTELNKLNI